MQTENEVGARILAALCEGAATVDALAEQAQVNVDAALATLRELGARREVLCARKRTRAGTARGPLYWYLVDNPLPPLRGRPKPPGPALTAVFEAAPGGYEARVRLDPIEILSRLACRGGFPNLTGAVGTGPGITPQELLHAAGAVEDKFGVAVAIAIACQSAHNWVEVHERGFPRVLASVQRVRALHELVRHDRRSRVRYVLHDAFHDAARWRRAIPWRDAAKAAKMRETDYKALYQHTAADLQDAAAGAARKLLKIRELDETEDACC